MYMDCHFIKGSAHEICEDYVYIDPINQFMIISDGCSTSKHSDVSARILVHACKKQLLSFCENNSLDMLVSSNGYNMLGELVLSHSKFVVSFLGFTECFATLGIAFIYKNKVYVYFYGDGFVAVNTVLSKNTEIYEIRYTKNEPNYLWRRVNPIKFAMSDSNLLDINGIKQFSGNEVRFEFDLVDLNFLGIFTDGVSSITSDNVLNDKFGHSIDGKSAIQHITSFKTIGGDFFKRRVNRFSKEFIASGFHNYDDIGGSIMIMENIDKVKEV